MKLRLPHKFQAALMAAIASVSFTTLSSASLGTAFFLANSAAAEDSATADADEIPEFNTGYADPDASPEESDKQQQIEVDQASIKTIEVGSNGMRGSSDDTDTDLTIGVTRTSAPEDLEDAADGADQVGTASSGSSLPSDDLGFTATPYATGSDTSNGSDDFSLTGTAPAAAYVPGQTGISASEGDSAAGTGSGSSTNKTTTGTIGSIGGTGSGATGGRVARPMALTAPNLLSPVSSLSVGGTSLGGDSGSASLAMLGAVTSTVSSPTAENAAGWFVHDTTTSTWTLSSNCSVSGNSYSFTEGGSVIHFNNNTGTNNRGVYTFAFTVDLAKLANVTGNTILLRAGNGSSYLSGVGMTQDRKLTMTWVDNAQYSGWTFAQLGSEGLVTIVLTEGNSGGYLSAYKNDAQWTVLQSRNGSKDLKGTGDVTQFTLGSELANAITAFAVWQTSDTWDPNNMLSAAQALSDLPLSEGLVWNGTSDSHTWTNNSSTPWTGGTFTEGADVTFSSLAANKEVLVQSAITAGTMKVSDAYTFKANSSGSLTAGALNLANNSAVTLWAETTGRTFSLGDVSVDGAASIMNRFNHATQNIDSIQGDASDTLTLISNHCNGTGTWNIGKTNGSAQAYSGKLVLQVQDTDGYNSRTVDFNIQDGGMFSGATLETKTGQLKSGSSADVKLMTNNINLGAIEVKFGGINDGVNDSSAASRQVKWTIKPTSGTSTLTLDGTGTYRTTSAVAANVNIKKTGAGTQTFGGDMSNFNGNITVNAGTLALTSAVGSADTVSVTGGTLNLGAALTTTHGVTVGSGATLKLASGNLLTSGGDLTLAGATLNLSGMNFTTGQTVTLATSNTGNIDYSGMSVTLSPKYSNDYTLNQIENSLTLTFNGAEPASNTLHIYLLTGQSNSLGCVKSDPASSAMLAEYAPKTTQMWDGNMSGSIDDPSVDTKNKAWQDEGKDWFLVQQQYAPTGKDVAGPSGTPYANMKGNGNLTGAWGGSVVMGTEYGFSYMSEKQGWNIGDASDIAIIKVSRDGGDNDFWNPDASKSICPQMLDTIIKAVKSVDATQYTDISLDGLLFLQGETGSAAQGANAKNVLNSMITYLQNGLNAAMQAGGVLEDYAGMFTVSVGDTIILGEPAGPGRTSTKLSAQVYKQWAGEDPDQVGFVYTQDLGLYTDNLHYDGNSQITIGARYAYAMAQVQGLDTTQNGTVRVRSQAYGDSMLEESTVHLNDAAAWWKSTGDTSRFVDISSLANTVAVWDVSSANMAKFGDERISADLALGGIRIEDPYSDDENPGDHKATITINNASGTGTHTLSVGAAGITLQQGNLTVNTDLTATASQTWNTAAANQQNTLNLTGTTTIADGATVTVEGASIVNISTLAGTGGLTVNGAGAVVTLTDKTDFTGATTITCGTLKSAGTDDLDITGNLTINGNAASFAGNITADTITLSNIATSGSQGTFDKYAGVITGTHTITLDHYTVDSMAASLVTKTLVATNSTRTTIHNLHLTACEINVGSGSNVTLADSLILGGTATYTGTLNLADGLTIDVSNMTLGGAGTSVALLSTENGNLGDTDISKLSVDFGSGSPAPEYSLSMSGNNLMLTLGAAGNELIWDHKNGIIWSLSENDKNWHVSEAGDGTSSFTTGSNVVFPTGTGEVLMSTDITAGNVAVQAGATLTLRTAGHNLNASTLTGIGGSVGGTLLVRGNGTVTIDGEVKMTTLNIAQGTIVMQSNATVDTIQTSAAGDRYITIAEGATVDVGNFNNGYGLNTLTVNGVMNVANTFKVATGGGVNNITGSGTINAQTVDVSNQTTKAAFSGVTLNIGSGGITGGKPIEFGTMTVGVTDDAQGWTANRSVTLATAGTTTFAPVADKTITLSGVVDGSGTLLKDGAGTLTLSGANTYSGGTIISAGTVNANNATALGGGLVYMTGGTLVLGTQVDTLSGDLLLDSGATLKLSQMNSDAVSTTGTLTLSNRSILDLTSLSITGREDSITLFQGGTITPTYLDSVVLNFSDSTLADRASLSVSGNNLVLTFAPLTHDLIWDGTNGATWDTGDNWHAADGEPGSTAFNTGDNVQFSTAYSTTATLENNVSAGNMVVDSGATATVNTAGHSLTATSLTGAEGAQGGNLTKQGAGLMKVDGPVNLTEVDVQDGSVELNSTEGGSIGTLKISAGKDATLGNIAASTTNKAQDNVEKTLSGNLTLNSGSVLTVLGNDALNYDANNTITVNKGGSINFNQARWTVGDTNHIILNGGSITGTGDGSNGALDFYEDSTVLATDDSTISAPIRLRNKTVTFNVSDNKTLTIAGLVNQHQSGSLTKTGAGTLLLSGANTYATTTTISEGTLETTSETALGTSKVTIAAGATLKVSENLTIQGGSAPAVDNSGTIEIANGKKLRLHATAEGRAYNLGNVVVEGDATIEDYNHNINASIASINGTVDSNITLFSNHSSTAATWTIGSSPSAQQTPYQGTLTLKAACDQKTGAAREVNFVLNDGNMLDGATLQLENGTTGGTLTNNIKLGAETVKLGGISDAADGTVSTTRKWNIGSSEGTHTLQLTGAYDYSSAVVINSNVNLLKTGSGKQTLTGDNANMNGTVTVNKGTLVAGSANALGTGAVTVASGATLQFSNTLTSSATTGSLSTSGGATLALGGMGDQALNVVGGSAADDGVLTLASGTILDISNLTLGEDTGSVKLAAAESLVVSDGVQSLALSGYGGYELTLTQKGNELWLDYENKIKTLVWRGRTSDIWMNENREEGTNKNWYTENKPGTNIPFSDYDRVRFATNATVQLGSDIESGRMLVDNDRSVTIDTKEHALSVDYIEGSGGSLTVKGTDDQTQATRIQGSTTLKNLTLDDGTASLGGHTEVSEKLTVQNDAKVTVSGTMATKALDISGESTVNLKAGGTAATTKVTDSTLTVGAASSLGQLTLDSGTVTNNATLTLSKTQDTMVRGDSRITGAGTTITIGIQLADNSTLAIDGGQTVSITTKNGIIGGSGKGSVLSLADVTMTGTDSWAVADTVDTVNLTSTTDSGTVFNTNGHNITVNAKLGGEGNLTKVGHGTLTLNGSNSFSGDTTVSAGVLKVSNANGLARSANVSVENGATLWFNSDTTASLSGTTSIADGATLHLGSENALTTTGSLTLSADSTLNLYGMPITSAKTEYVLATGSSIALADGFDMNNVIVEYGTHPAVGTLPKIEVKNIEGGQQALVLTYDIIDSNSRYWNGVTADWTASGTWHDVTTKDPTTFAEFDDVFFAPTEYSNPSAASVQANITQNTHVHEMNIVAREGEGADKNTVNVVVNNGQTLTVDFLEADVNTALIKQGAGTAIVGIDDPHFGADVSVTGGTLTAQYMDLNGNGMMEVTGDLAANGGTLNVIIGRPETPTNIEFTSDSSVSNLSSILVDENSTAVFNGEVSVPQNVTVDVRDGAELVFGGNTNMSANRWLMTGEGSVHFTGPVTLSEDTNNYEKIDGKLTVTFDDLTQGKTNLTLRMQAGTDTNIGTLHLKGVQRCFYLTFQYDEQERGLLEIDTLDVADDGATHGIGSLCSKFGELQGYQQQGSISIAQLTGGGTVSLFNYAYDNNNASGRIGYDSPEVFYVGGKSVEDKLFSGNIQLADGGFGVSEANKSKPKHTVLVLEDEIVASQSVIQINNADTGTGDNRNNGKYSNFGIGIDADNVKVQGIEDVALQSGNQVKIFSGSVGTETNASYGSDDTVRTLQLTGKTTDTAAMTYSSSAGFDKNVDIVKQGAGVQEFKGDSSKFNGSIDAQDGVLRFLNTASLTVQDLTLAENGSATDGTLAVRSDAAGTNVGMAEVHGTLKANSGSKLASNLTMATDSTMNVRGSLTTQPGEYEGKTDYVGGLDMLNNSLTLQSGAYLSNADRSALLSMQWGERYELAYNLSSLTLGETTYTDELLAERGNPASVEASKYFQNLQEDDYYICFSGIGTNQAGPGGNVGTVYIMKLPEPTTSTLSLLALCALAARRRRK